jgi:hypothetical protein
VRVAAKRWMALRRRIWRTAMRSRGRRDALVHVKRPVWALRYALREYRTRGAVLTAAGISPRRQLVQTWWGDLRYRVRASVARHYSISPSSNRRTARLCLIAGANMPQVYKLLRAASDPQAADTLADKQRFAAWCEAHALPSLPTLAYFEEGRLVRLSTADGRLPDQCLFSKWSDRFGGADTEIWRYENGAYRSGDGRTLTSTVLIEELAAQSRDGPVLLQPRLVNHPDVECLSPSALSTIRVMTTAAAGAPPLFFAGLLRMGTGSATADNFAQGGIAAPIDAETGELGDARGLDADGLPHLYRHHPDTGVAITGSRIPFWRESVELALRAHSLLGDFPVVGWDIAVSPSGAVLVEGNWNPCTKLLQVATQTPLLATTLATTVLERIDEPLRRNDDRWLLSVIM